MTQPLTVWHNTNYTLLRPKHPEVGGTDTPTQILGVHNTHSLNRMVRRDALCKNGNKNWAWKSVLSSVEEDKQTKPPQASINTISEKGLCCRDKLIAPSFDLDSWQMCKKTPVQDNEPNSNTHTLAVYTAKVTAAFQKNCTLEAVIRSFCFKSAKMLFRVNKKPRLNSRTPFLRFIPKPLMCKWPLCPFEANVPIQVKPVLEYHKSHEE